MRVYKLRAFARFQRREGIADPALAHAVREAEGGLIGADLGGGLIKQRVARPGQGKRSGYRTVVAYRRGERAVFLLGFAKSERDNIDAGELAELRAQGQAFLGLRMDQIAALVREGDLTEVDYDEAK